MISARRRLPLLCASVGDIYRLHVEPCSGKACGFYDRSANVCTAGTESAELFTRWFTSARDAALPHCPITERCAWHVAAVRRKEPGCFVRRLGLVCEHQVDAPGVDKDLAIWNTFNMAEPDDPCWGTDQESA